MVNLYANISCSLAREGRLHNVQSHWQSITNCSSHTMCIWETDNNQGSAVSSRETSLTDSIQCSHRVYGIITHFSAVGIAGIGKPMLEWTSIVQVVEHGKSINSTEAKHNSSWHYMHHDKSGHSSLNNLKNIQTSSPSLSLSMTSVINVMRINTATTDVTVPVRIVDTISLWMRLKKMWVSRIRSRPVVGNSRKHTSE